MTTKRIHKDDLLFGETYETVKESAWSKFIELKDEEGTIYKTTHGERTTIPAGQRLIFRSFAPYNLNTEQKLALFYWLEKRTTVCLVVSESLCWFDLEYIPWEIREDLFPKTKTEFEC